MQHLWLFVAIVAFGVVAGIASAGDPQPSTAPQQASAPQRMITLAPNAAEIICALGHCDRLVGVSKYCVYPEELRSRARVGGLFDPDIERIITLRPDLIILRGHSEAVERTCADRGIRLYFDKTDSLGELRKTVHELGEILGSASRARQLVDAFDEKMDTIRRRSVGLEKPRVLLTLSRQPDRLANILTATGESFLNEMLTAAGGENVFADLSMTYPQVSAEAILTRRPDVIIEFMPETHMTKTLRTELLAQWKSLGPLPASRDGRVFFITDDHALIPSLRCAEIVDKMSRLLHPDTKHDR